MKNNIVVGAILLGLGLFYLQGCALSPPELTDYSDKGVNSYAIQTLKFLGWGSETSNILGYGGAISLAGLSSGTLLAVASRSGAASGLALGSAVVSWVLAILKPTGHGNAIVEASGLILMARKKYFENKTAAGISTVPDNCMTTFGGVFVGEIDAAINKFLSRTQELAPLDPQPPSGNQSAVGGRQKENNCGR